MKSTCLRYLNTMTNEQDTLKSHYEFDYSKARAQIVSPQSSLKTA